MLKTLSFCMVLLTALVGCDSSSFSFEERPGVEIPSVYGQYRNEFSVLEFKDNGILVIKSPSGTAVGRYRQVGTVVHLLTEDGGRSNALDVKEDGKTLTDRGLVFWSRLKRSV